MLQMEMEQRQPFAWCPACRRTQPCVRNLGTTDWQTTPIYTCHRCGGVTREPVIRSCPPGMVPIDTCVTCVPTAPTNDRPSPETAAPHTTIPRRADDDPSSYAAIHAALTGGV